MINIFLQEFAELGFGYDVQFLSADVTVGDYIKALDDFQAATMADCRGCDGCCHERIPLTYADFFLAKPLIAEVCHKTINQVTLADWLDNFAELQLLGEAIDLTLKRKPDGSCLFLDMDKKECSRHAYRTLVCRSHCCLPKSQRALKLRSAIINSGEDELCRQLLQTTFPPNWQNGLKNSKVSDYQPNGFSQTAGDKWKTVPIQTLVSPQLWGKLFMPQENLA